MKFSISCRNFFKYFSKLVKYWRYGSKSIKEVTLYVDLLICSFCKGSKHDGILPICISRRVKDLGMGFHFVWYVPGALVVPLSVGQLGYP